MGRGESGYLVWGGLALLDATLSGIYRTPSLSRAPPSSCTSKRGAAQLFAPALLRPRALSLASVRAHSLIARMLGSA